MPSVQAMDSANIKKENAQSIKVLDDLMAKLSVSKSQDEVNAVTNNIATFINGPIEEQDAPTKAVDAITKQLNNKKDAAARERGLNAIQAIAEHSQIAASVEPYLIVLLPSVLAAVGDKTPAVKTAANAAALAIVKGVNANAVKALLPPIINSILTAQKWQEKITGLTCIEALVETSASQLALRVPDLIPVVSESMWDTKPEVKKMAYGTMEKVCGLIVNKDIDRFIPELIKCIAKPENVPETIHLLGATTFVTDVHEPTLAIMVPLLDRGLAERETAIKRKSAVIVDNMCKLVEDPNIVAAFLPKLMPGLTKNYENLADPEAREKTKQGLDTLSRVGAVVDGKIPEPSHAGSIPTVLAILKQIVATKHKDAVAKFEPSLYYIASLAGQLIDEKDADTHNWTSAIKPYVVAIAGETDAQDIVDELRRRASPGAEAEDAAEADDEEGEDLCNCTFNLAYGAKILLNQTHLRLKRGQRYGLCGPNGSGKSTLMRAINNEQVEGFPKKSEVKTVFVEHDLDSADTEQTTIAWTMKKLAEVGVETSQEDVEKQLSEFGFTSDMTSGMITALSGGWKMKLALARAVFEDPDILLLDEPTNHLDVKNVKWLEDYLQNSPCTSIIVSHDSKFLDNVCQHIIHYERYKLKRYRGNLKEFVKKCPSAKSYYELGASEIEFKFPEPGFLEGVKTKAKAIVRVNKMSFQYEGTPKPQITDISFQCSLGSRIAVIGPNGAGKSTLINVLTGELIPTIGDVYTHENIRIAYIKQHAFAHIDHHLEKTPSEYIQWRFQTGEDRETMDRANKIVTDEDEKAMDKAYRIEGTLRRVIGIHSRRKFKNSYEYECSFALGENIGLKNERWVPMMTADNAWIPRTEILASHQKMVAEVDQKEALASGQFRPLVRKEIEQHCANFGLDAELVSHSRMLGLSGGQRVKVVLAACSWQRPHLIVLDEPTNYLDRDSLGALSKAIKSFEGGVIIITHSAEFTKDLTEEVWAVVDGKMTPSGHNWVQGQGAGPRLKGDDEEEERFDALGNKLESTKKKAKLSSAELRKKKKDRMARRKRGEEVFTDEDDAYKIKYSRQSTSVDASTDPPRAADVAEEVDEDEILAILDRDEVAFGDAIGDDRDEDFIPGPDDDDGSGDDDDGEADAGPSSSSDEIATSGGGAEIAAEGGANPPAASHMAPAQQMSDDRCKAQFRRRMLTAITGLKEFAKGIKYDPTRQGQGSTYLVSYSFWFLLCRVATDDLMESYMAIIPRKVQVLLGQGSLTPASILSLDRDWKHYHLSKGVYINLPFDKWLRPSVGSDHDDHPPVMPSPLAQLEIHEHYLNVPEIIRRFHLIIEVPKAWRLITIREAVLFISERELPREPDGSFSLTNGQRAKGLLFAACCVLQDGICKDTERPGSNCSTVFGCYLLEGLNAYSNPIVT
ncbi:hypothetical protein V501_05958 [Pseudogymnoascus sp. VKM F-4519 (FW-2642)]|nr:hypothetical protein V501_05958 [Pseudogymnoascus sp. VKM F-4519 (FW-2642)]